MSEHLHAVLAELQRRGWPLLAGGNGEGDGPQSGPASGQQQDAPGTPPGQQGGNTASDDGPKFTQAQVDALIRDRLDRERKRAEDSQRKAADDADAKRLAEQQEFKALADKHAARVTELEPYQAKAERYETALKALLAEERKAVPDHLAPLLDRMDPADQLEYLAANRDKLVPPANGHGAAAGVPATPRAAGAPNREHAITEKVDTLRRTGAYGRF